MKSRDPSGLDVQIRVVGAAREREGFAHHTG